MGFMDLWYVLHRVRATIVVHRDVSQKGVGHVARKKVKCALLLCQFGFLFSPASNLISYPKRMSKENGADHGKLYLP
jgi:hypothetical protein